MRQIKVAVNTRSDSVSLPLEERLVSVIIDHVGPNFVTGKLVRSVEHDTQQIERIRASLPPGKKPADFEIHKACLVFLDKPLREHPNTWHASVGLLADRSKNPWYQGGIRAGDEVEGEVIRYVYDYGAIVQLRKNHTQGINWKADEDFTGFLHRRQTPDPELRIQDSVHIGNRLWMRIEMVEEERLRIDLDIKNLRSELNSTPLADQQSSLRLTSRLSVPDVKWTKKRVLLIDDNPVFCRSTQKALRDFNVEVRYTLRFEDLPKENEYLKTCDAVLVDFNMEGTFSKEWDNVVQELDVWRQQHPARQGVIISGNDNKEIVHELTPVDWLTRYKPLDLGQLRQWLNGGDWAEVRTRKIDNTQGWKAVRHDGLIIERAEGLLNRCMKRINAAAALWVVRSRPGVYEIRVQLPRNINSSGVETTLGATAVANALDAGGEILQLSLQASGATLKEMAPKEVTDITVLPIETEGQFNRCIVFFTSHRLNHEALVFLHEQIPHIQDIVLSLYLNQSLNASAPMATQGLLRSSELHEMRNLIGALKSEVEAIKNQAGRPAGLGNPQEVSQSLEAVYEITDMLTELGENGLDRIREEQKHEVELVGLISNTVNLMRYQGRSSRVRVSFDPRDYPDPISLPLYRKQIELPLINLIDNAIHHSYKNGIS